MKFGYFAFFAMLLFSIASAAFIDTTATPTATTPYCGDGICTRAGTNVMMSYYDEASTSSSYYCPRDCGTPTPSYCPTPSAPTCRIVCDSPVNGATVSNNGGGVSGGGISSGSSGSSSATPLDNANSFWILIAFIVGLLIGYWYKKGKKK